MSFGGPLMFNHYWDDNGVRILTTEQTITPDSRSNRDSTWGLGCSWGTGVWHNNNHADSAEENQGTTGSARWGTYGADICPKNVATGASGNDHGPGCREAGPEYQVAILVRTKTPSGDTCECSDGEWRDPARGGICADWTTCEAGQRVTARGNGESDRECAECAQGSFSVAENAAECALLGEDVVRRSALVLTGSAEPILRDVRNRHVSPFTVMTSTVVRSLPATRWGERSGWLPRPYSYPVFAPNADRLPTGQDHARDGVRHPQHSLWITLWRRCGKRRGACEKCLWTKPGGLRKWACEYPPDLGFVLRTDCGQGCG